MDLSKLDRSEEKILVLKKGYYPPISKVVKSGWKDFFFVIYEDPECGDYHYEIEFVHRSVLIEKYQLTEEDLRFALRKEPTCP